MGFRARPHIHFRIPAPAGPSNAVKRSGRKFHCLWTVFCYVIVKVDRDQEINPSIYQGRKYADICTGECEIIEKRKESLERDSEMDVVDCMVTKKLLYNCAEKLAISLNDPSKMSGRTTKMYERSVCYA